METKVEEKSVEGVKAAGEGGAQEEQPEKQQEQEEEAEVKERADGTEGQSSIFQSPLRLVRKSRMKLVVCHVTLLDGSDFTCEVEVRLFFPFVGHT